MASALASGEPAHGYTECSVQAIGKKSRGKIEAGVATAKHERRRTTNQRAPTTDVIASNASAPTMLLAKNPKAAK